MTIKLLLLKSGEDIIADVQEMAVGEEGSIDTPKRVVGYFLNKPCVVKMKDPRTLDEQEKGGIHKAGFQVSLFPWMPLAKEETIPITADWVITMVEPMNSLKKMYQEDIVNHGQSNQSNSTSKQSKSDK